MGSAQKLAMLNTCPDLDLPPGKLAAQFPPRPVAVWDCAAGREPGRSACWLPSHGEESVR